MPLVTPYCLFTLSLVVPLYNEAEALPIFLEAIYQTFSRSPHVTLEIIFVNDGSQDETLERLFVFQKKDPRIKILDLSRNFGKEAALTAGLDASTGDAIVPIDVDLQDPSDVILDMIGKWKEGYEVVLGRRISRDSDSWIKSTTARWFYQLHNKMATVRLPNNIGDFRLMDRCVVEALKTLPESCRFMKGIFAWVGFRTTYVDYKRPERSVGQTKFNNWKLWNFALEGITSFSTVPLRIWMYVGFLFSGFSFLFGFSIFLKVLIQGVDVPGHASLLVAVTFFGGIQLMGIGILGEYLGRNYLESKRRPVYLLRRAYHGEDV